MHWDSDASVNALNLKQIQCVHSIARQMFANALHQIILCRFTVFDIDFSFISLSRGMKIRSQRLVTIVIFYHSLAVGPFLPELAVTYSIS
jgi:hypothetical protein